MSEIDLDEASLRDLVMVNDGQVVTTSLKVAERFGKRHDNVLRAIDNLDCSAGFRLLNFEETVMWRENPSGGEPIKSRSFDMTKDGFMFLVMGFRGKAAAAWKEAFIQARPVQPKGGCPLIRPPRCAPFPGERSGSDE
ncbi:Rha family transcriptional regulator [Pseudomonas aeruginosa]